MLGTPALETYPIPPGRKTTGLLLLFQFRHHNALRVFSQHSHAHFYIVAQTTSEVSNLWQLLLVTNKIHNSICRICGGSRERWNLRFNIMSTYKVFAIFSSPVKNLLPILQNHDSVDLSKHFLTRLVNHHDYVASCLGNTPNNIHKLEC